MILIRHDTPTERAAQPTSAAAPALDRAQHLRAATHTTHERLDATIMAAEPFANLGNYGRFLQVQHGFHRDVSGLYHWPALQALIPDLAAKSRYAAVCADAADLGIALQLSEDTPPTVAQTATPSSVDDGPGIDLAEALGWLYVVEGSNLGAAFLFKAALKMGLSAEHGARHLAEGPEGRAASWRAFKAALAAVPLTPAQEARAVSGAEAAFARVRELVALHLTPFAQNPDEAGQKAAAPGSAAGIAADPPSDGSRAIDR